MLTVRPKNQSISVVKTLTALFQVQKNQIDLFAMNPRKPKNNYVFFRMVISTNVYDAYLELKIVTVLK